MAENNNIYYQFINYILLIYLLLIINTTAPFPFNTNKPNILKIFLQKIVLSLKIDFVSVKSLRKKITICGKPNLFCIKMSGKYYYFNSIIKPYSLLAIFHHNHYKYRYPQFLQQHVTSQHLYAFPVRARLFILRANVLTRNTEDKTLFPSILLL